MWTWIELFALANGRPLLTTTRSRSRDPSWTNLAHGEVPHSGNSGSQIPCDGHDTRSMFSLVHDRGVTKNELQEHSTVPLVRPISTDLDAMSDYIAHSVQYTKATFVDRSDICMLLIPISNMCPLCGSRP